MNYHPRYVGNCTEEHFTTPRRRKNNLLFIKYQHFLQNKKIKSLQQQNRQLKKKVKSLQSMLEELKDQNLVSENAAHVLMVNISNLKCILLKIIIYPTILVTYLLYLLYCVVIFNYIYFQLLL